MKNKRRKVLAVGGVTAGAALLAGVAFAALGGTVFGSNVIVGTAAGQGSCQSTSIDFILADPSYNTSLSRFEILSVDFAGFSSVCVGGGAELSVVIRSNTGTVYEQVSITPTGTSGSIAFTNAVSADVAPNVMIDYLVQG